MGQPHRVLFDRRRDPREPKAFAFWLRPSGSHHRTSAWMLDVSAGGAAFLTPADQVPALGTRIELVEMLSRDRTVREGACPLPSHARVVRHDEPTGATRRVAVRFESDALAPVRVRAQRGTAAVCRRSPGPPPLPPPFEAPRHAEIALRPRWRPSV